ncbi:hypothetical protein [Dokdonella sp.]|uniref:hypothetical protein n=1 Tax=Dokdonella sp. TaxID=2291710 RepID=UPI003BAF7F49
MRADHGVRPAGIQVLIRDLESRRDKNERALESRTRFRVDDPAQHRMAQAEMMTDHLHAAATAAWMAVSRSGFALV